MPTPTIPITWPIDQEAQYNRMGYYITRLRQAMEADIPIAVETMRRVGVSPTADDLDIVEIPEAPPVPGNVATEVKPFGVLITWTHPVGLSGEPDPTIKAYDVQRAADANFTNSVVSLGRVAGLQLVDFSVVPGQTWWYRVRSVRETENKVSDWSTAVVAIIPPVGTTEIADAAITEVKIQDAAVSTAKVADLAVTSAKIADLAVTTAKIAALAVGTAKIADLAVTTGKIDNLAVTEAKIDNLAVTEGKIGNLAVTTAKISDLAVTTAKIDNLSVTEGKIGNLAVTTGKIQDLAVTTAKIANLAVTTGKIQDLAVTTGKINDLAVTEAKIGNLAVTTGKIADLAITDAKIDNATITGAKIASATITAANIEDATITGAKIANGTITSANIQDATIATADIADAAITTAKIADAQITTAKIADLAVTAAKIDNATITGAKIANATITEANIANAAITNAKIGTAEIDSLKLRLDPYGWIENPHFEMGDVGWIKQGRWSIANDPTNAFAGSWVAFHGPGESETVGLVNNARFAVVPGRSIFIAFRFKNTGVSTNGSLIPHIYWYDVNDQFISATPVTGGTTLPTTVYSREVGLLENVTPPSGTVYARAGIVVSNHSTGTWYVDVVEFGTGIGSHQIEASAVTESRIFPGAVTESRIFPGAVTTSKIQNGAVSIEAFDYQEPILDTDLEGGEVALIQLPTMTNLEVGRRMMLRASGEVRLGVGTAGRFRIYRWNGSGWSQIRGRDFLNENATGSPIRMGWIVETDYVPAQTSEDFLLTGARVAGTSTCRCNRTSFHAVQLKR